jgi:hypothetical protein
MEKTVRDIYSFIHEKVEKLSTGLYMVTSYMAESEPVRSSLRILALSTVGHTAHISMKKLEDRYLELQKDILHITSLLKLSQTLEIMSKMNSDILIQEYEKLSQIVSHQKDTKDSKKINVHVLHEDDHFQSVLTGQQIQKDRLIQNQSGLKTSNTILSTQQKTLAGSSQNQYHTYPPLQQKSTTSSATNKKIINVQEHKERRGKRQELVLQILSTDIPMTIGDVAARIKGCSEKTIQRELQGLVDNKKVKRIGEKRWSKYIKI